MESPKSKLSQSRSVLLEKQKRKRSEIELLNWVIKVLMSGKTTGMVRAIVQRKIKEIEDDSDTTEL